MSPRDSVAIVCRDCGELGHFQLTGLKPGSLVHCASCGLVTDPWRGAPPLTGPFLGPRGRAPAVRRRAGR